MKKWVMVVFLVSIFSLAACAQDETNGKTEEDSANEQETQEEDNTNNEDNMDEESENAEESNSSKETDTSTDQETTTDEEQEQTEDEVATEEPIEPKYKINDVWSVVPLEGQENVNSEVVLLTIDDAPDEHALEMAKTLKEHNASAIFFVNGHFLETEEKQEILKQIHDMGFAIGNHTYHHQKLDDVGQAKQREEIVSLNNKIEEIIGERPKFFRAPHGVNTDYAKQVVEEEGMVLMNWSFGYDFKADYMTKDAITDIMLNTPLLGSGSNLLMHDREWTSNALGDIVKGLKDKGYGFVNPAEIQTPGE
ncbi:MULTISPECIES: polysaccharide deacetylase family protein [Pontibacillus]|uniref:Polysaccharide deacetylase family protein n=1 Tax=Pontibacillus chungwhensis TaxID=265426 RepID=A0ABY8V1J6_9BACI|nr:MULTISPECIES: polysaccharide deacetylase family protein [Pontibacillus]MCD5322527.1 polysaccharide deacetylase family protein [Pontibacillus sp. HN14]WIF99812.1 polysaccharide deacetylase family protein [Pontibacillus chungwhensis]